ncbi:MAG: hypothetical protein DCC67_00600 [Planctomycetota bacterium]|nr:MAG: hypothetical protein DCC67_00600 [Planctomycetota bacterium]
MARPRNSSSPLFTLTAIIIAIAALHVAKEILLPLALAILISFLLTPLANRLERLGLGRVPSVLAVVSVTFAVLGVLGWIVTWQLADLGSQLPRDRVNLIRKIESIKPRSSALQDITDTIEDVEKTLAKDDAVADAQRPDAPSDEPAKSPRDRLAQADSDEKRSTNLYSFFQWSTDYDQSAGPGERAEQEPIDVRVVGMPLSPLQQLLSWMGPLMAPITTAGVTIVLVIFILLKREDQRNRLLQLFGKSHLHATTEALTDVTERVSRYLRMQFLINATYGVCVGAGLYFIGVPGAIMWGVLSFALRFLPYIGPWLSAVMPLLVSVARSEGWTQPMLVIAWFTLLELLVNNVAEPLLYGRTTGVSGVGVIVAAIFWTWVWGAVGLVLAMPLTVCIVVMARYIPGLHFLTVLLGDQPPMSDEQRIYQRLLAGDGDEALELVAQRVKATSLAEAYDEAVIPAIALAEADRHAALLNEDQEELVEATARDLVEELGERYAAAAPALSSDTPADGPATPRRRLRVLGIPLRDDADEISAIMLKQLLDQEGMDVELAGVQTLTGEVVELVQQEQFDATVICILPPLPPRNSRLLCRRLRDRHPALSIIVGYWCGQCHPELRRRLCAEDGEAVTTLVEAVERLKAIAARPQLAAERAG